ncbi:MAG: Ribosomal protein S12 methylthiotransferase RimO [Candidatus Omnitrophica bacterium ADurb.Bin277]|nr:MAG: Ribosomal protein S12 methylthiotransferase RimO [Candidatus Omnitrophica bacterium ADurb.Bin277]
MKLVLIQPPIRDFYDTDIRLQPIGLAYLKSAVKKHLPRIRVVIRDYHAGWGRRTVPWPKELRHLKAFYGQEDKSPFSTFHHFYHFGADFETIADETAGEKPDLVGISSLFSPYCREVLETAAAIKRKLNVPILAGGSHASALPETMLAHPAIDFVIRGEGERPLVEFLRKMSPASKPGVARRHQFRALSGVPNLGFKKNGRIILNPCGSNYPVNRIPFPDLPDLPKNRYLYEGKPLCFILTSRGCPYRCAFCSVHTTFGHRYRRRSNSGMLRELKLRYSQGYRVFDFEDDNLTFDKKAAGRLFRQFEKMFPKKDVRFLAMNGICYWDLNGELLGLMRRAGFTHLNLSLVSSDPSVCKSMRRPLNRKKYRTVVSQAFKLGFRIVSYQILGLPGDSPDSMVKTLVLNARLPVLLGASPFYVPPGSPIGDSLNEADPFTTARLTNLGIESAAFTREDIYTLFVTTRILNFLKGIPLQKDCRLETALKSAAKYSPRSRAGVFILKKLLREEPFSLWTPRGFRHQPFFKTELFHKAWASLDRIVTRQGRSVLI